VCWSKSSGVGVISINISRNKYLYGHTHYTFSEVGQAQHIRGHAHGIDGHALSIDGRAHGKGGRTHDYLWARPC
jgi:hypothetical protein